MKRISVTGDEPITTAQAKTYLGIDHSDQDTLIAELITEAREFIEKEINHSLVTTEWQQTLYCFPTHTITLGKNPYQSLSTFTYTNDSGIDTAVSASVYDIDDSTTPVRIRLAYEQEWPENRDYYNSIKINFIAGWDHTASVWDGPAELAVLIKKIVYARYHNPAWDIEGMKNKIPGMDRILNHYNVESYLA